MGEPGQPQPQGLHCDQWKGLLSAYPRSRDTQVASGSVPALPQLGPLWPHFPHLLGEGLYHMVVREPEPEGVGASVPSLLSDVSVQAAGVWLGCPTAPGFSGQGSCARLHLEPGVRMDKWRALPFLEASLSPAGKPQQLYLGLPSTA